jgi:hypothetical protein
VNEPENHSALVDKMGGTWVRVDEYPGQWANGTWYPITDGPGFEQQVQDGVGQARPWSWLDEYAPFIAADEARTERALRLVRRAVER